MWVILVPPIHETGPGGITIVIKCVIKTGLKTVTALIVRTEMQLEVVSFQ